MNAPRIKTPRPAPPPLIPPPKVKKSTLTVTDAQIVRALKDCTGHMANTAAKVGLEAATIRRRIMNSPYLKETREKIIIEVNAVAEANVVDAIFEGDLNTSKWWLDRTKFKEDQGSFLLPPPIGDAPCLVKT